MFCSESSVLLKGNLVAMTMDEPAPGNIEQFPEAFMDDLREFVEIQKESGDWNGQIEEPSWPYYNDLRWWWWVATKFSQFSVSSGER